MATLTQQIKEKALEIGFSKVGIAKIEPIETDAGRLKEWLSRGYQASMRWMEENSDKRADPRKIVPGARSVISVAANYYTAVQHHPENGEGKISRYAWGDDYHILITSRIQKLFQCIKQMAPESEGRYYVDTGPVMDKVWAERAGLGWRGKHTNLITKDFGSWVFLGEIITTLPLEYDTPVEDACGTCTACLDACPTQAIVEPYVLDSNKCISYLTIEHRGPIDASLAQQFDGWVYGCDICQDVCPWNKFQQVTHDPEFSPRDGNVTPSLDGLISLTQEEFSKKFSKSPIKRTKREGLVRNAELLQNGKEQKIKLQ
ncbi:MAG TPA: tRNA epoxyqueuosine(34) reductase QueG [Bacteroidota bacterium]|nr:tRNA epoxyqueuosine(34) reductase QueG [Bacteroidota bacterium]